MNTWPHWRVFPDHLRCRTEERLLRFKKRCLLKLHSVEPLIMVDTRTRIVNITDEKVTFIARDYRQGATKKYITLGGVEFLRRFARHILSRRFVKIRRYSIYNRTVKQNLGIKYQFLSLSGV
jgi:hypothetical protein